MRAAMYMDGNPSPAGDPSSRNDVSTLGTQSHHEGANPYGPIRRRGGMVWGGARTYP